MSKYVLAKDLPFAKAGADVWIDNTWTAWIDGDIYFPTAGVCEFRKGKIMLGKIGNLKIEGWIKSVEPREFYCSIFPSGNGYLYKTKDMAEEDKKNFWAIHNEKGIEVIKVREVL